VMSIVVMVRLTFKPGLIGDAWLDAEQPQT
jgi:hypothetical protein